MNVYECRINATTGELEAVIRRKDFKSVERAVATCIGFSLKTHHGNVIAWADSLQGDEQEIIIAAEGLLDASRLAILFFMVFR